MTDLTQPSTAINAQITYRHATEFFRQHKRPIDPAQSQEWLRVFEDGDGILRAGLYHTPQPNQDDHWATGEPLTDNIDTEMATRALWYTIDNETEGTEALKTTLLGIAYTQLYVDTRRALNIHVPIELEPWTMATWAGNPYTGHWNNRVMATDSKTAKAIAAVLLFHAVAKNGYVSRQGNR